MDFWTKLKGLRAVGIGNAFRSLAYGFKRDRVDRRHLPRQRCEEAVPPGGVVGFSALAGGLKISFENAQLEVQFLTNDFVRVTWQPGELPVAYTIAQSVWPTVKATYDAIESGWFLASGKLRVEVDASGAIRFLRADGTLVRSDGPPLRGGDSWTLPGELTPEESIFGMGERTRRLDLRGHSYRNWNREPKGAYTHGDDPLYVSVPVYLSRRKEGAHLAYFENSFDSTFSFKESSRHEFAGGALRYYVAVGSPAHCMDRYTALTGRPAMPPRWALGYHQARWSYMDEAEVRQLAADFRKHELPLHAIHLDIHYMDDYRVFTVDPVRFPDLPKLTSDLRDDGVHTVVILDPGIKTDPEYDVFASGLKGNVFCRYPDGELAVGPVWPGPCAFPDFTRIETREWWGDHYGRVVDWGIDGVWHDMNEVAVFAAHGEPTLPLATRHDFDGRGGDHREGHNLYALLEARAGYEGLKRARPDGRPWILSRSGWAGVQRYAWTWTGDCESDWWTLGQSVRIALGMGLSGIPYNGPDIGGFGGSPSAELFTRWFQVGALLPFFRTHCAVFAPRREPWVFGEPTLGIVREFLRLREQLMPYLYTLAYEANQTGAPLVRPLFWEFADDADVTGVDDQFLLGSSLLVAPVMEAGATVREVVLPPGKWFDFWSDEILEGGRTISAEVTLERIPIYVRDGSAIPLAKGDETELHLFLATSEQPKSAPLGRLYSDAGDGFGPHRYEGFAVAVQGGKVAVSRAVIQESGFAAPDLSVALHGPIPESLATNI
jgi:alpha-glucosidase